MTQLSNNNQETPSLLQQFKTYITNLIDLEYQKENEHFTIEVLKDEVDFRGARIWILVCAILIASLGLNVNSTAVIIGAMLISPLMGPIIGFGLGLGITDFELIKRSLRNLVVITIFSVLTATLYFLISPIDWADSELLARTQPTIYDVLIAFVGGVAGMIAISSRNKGNVATGVAIATALMPPLCTAGFGLSQLNWSYFFGAFYLFIINSVFIALATFAMVRVLRFPRKSFVDKDKEKRIRRLVAVISIVTIIPSIYYGFQLIQRSIVEDGAHQFVRKHLDGAHRQVIREELQPSIDGGYTLSVSLIGEKLSTEYIDSVRTLMADYGLGNTSLYVKQGLTSQSDSLDIQELRSVVLQDLYTNSDRIINDQRRQIDSLQRIITQTMRYTHLMPTVSQELQTLYPNVRRLSVAAQEVQDGKEELLIVLDTKKRLDSADVERITAWLKKRLLSERITIVQTK